MLRLASAYRSAPCIYYPGSCSNIHIIIILIIIIIIIYNIIIIIILCATYIVKVLNITLAFLLEILHPVKNNISRYLDYSSQYISPCLYSNIVCSIYPHVALLVSQSKGGMRLTKTFCSHIPPRSNNYPATTIPQRSKARRNSSPATRPA